MDAPDNSRDFLILAAVASLGSRSFPVAAVGGLRSVVPATTLAAASSSTAPAATASVPSTAASALATRGTVTSDVPGSAAVVATVLTDPISSTLLPDGEVLEHAAVLEQVVAFWMDVAPGITFTFFLGSRRGLGLLRKRLGDEDPLVGSRVPLLVLS